MASYARDEARDWAREHLLGVVNVIIPSFTNDLRGINEAAVRHDVRKQVEHGFTGALLVSEVTITQPEYREFCEIAADEAAGRQLFVHHSSWSDYETAVTGLRIAEETGAELVLLSYPPNFYPLTENDLYDYTRAICDATSLGVMLFPVGLWGFSDRIHPSDIPVAVIRRLIDDCPNVVAIKAEGGYPSTFMGTVEAWRRFGEEVVISCPIEGHLIPLAQLMPIQVSATSDTEYYGPMIPRIFAHLEVGEFDVATELFWQAHPARKAKDALGPELHGTGFLNRQAWKFQAWLQGYNGGPLRAPTLRIHDRQMNALRAGLKKSGLEPTQEPNAAFFTGRNPTEIPQLPSLSAARR
jgi:4-hydroxy-tetrahydrodipicolinate synthase